MELDYFTVMPALARLSWRAALWWGRRRGDARFWWRTVGREAAIANLRHAYGGAIDATEARRIIRACFRTQTCEEAETYFYPSLTRDAFGKFVAVDGREHLDAALAAGKGAIVFTSHYGSLCLAIIALARLGYRMNVIARSLEPDDNPLNEVVRRYGEAKVAELERICGIPFIIPGKPGAMERMRAALVEQARARGDRLVVCDIPLLFERRMTDSFDRIVLVDAPRPTRLERLVRERGLKETEAMDMIVAQMPAELKRARADHIIDNEGTLSQLDSRVGDVWSALQAEAAERESVAV